MANASMDGMTAELWLALPAAGPAGIFVLQEKNLSASAAMQ